MILILFGTGIHINMMKCEVLINMEKPIMPFSAEDYAEICKLDTEENRRQKLVEILTQKEKERIKDLFKGDKKMYDAAVDLIRENQRTSVSFVQRKLKIGFTVASAIVEQLQEDGIVSAPDVNGRREVLIAPKDNPNLGKVLNQKDDPDEPVLEPVAQKDAEVGGIAVDRLRSLIERVEAYTIIVGQYKCVLAVEYVDSAYFIWFTPDKRISPLYLKYAKRIIDKVAERDLPMFTLSRPSKMQTKMHKFLGCKAIGKQKGLTVWLYGG